MIDEMLTEISQKIRDVFREQNKGYESMANKLGPLEMLKEMQNKLTAMLEEIEDFVNDSDLTDQERLQNHKTLVQAGQTQKKEYRTNWQRKKAEADKALQDFKRKEALRKQLLTFSRDGLKNGMERSKPKNLKPEKPPPKLPQDA